MLKTAFRAAWFRTGWYSDDHAELERIYRTLKDPWNFETSRYEQDRLRLLLDVIGQHRPDSILEVGCAEGLFTTMLSTMAPRVVAIDVSPTAVERAKKRDPAPTYVVASLEKFTSGEKFDIVVCAETLYYIRDVAGAIEQLSALGRRCVVSYLEREAKRLDPYLLNIPSVELLRYNVGGGPGDRMVVVAVWDTAA